MKILVSLRRGEGPAWSLLKSVAKHFLGLHIPVNRITRSLFRLMYRCHVLVREALIWTLRFFYYEPLFRSKCQVVGHRFQMEALPYMLGDGDILVGAGVRLSGKSSILFSNRVADRPKISFGDGTFVGHGCSFHAADSILIGSHCLIAAGSSIYDHDGHPYDAEQRRAGLSYPRENCAPVVIGKDVWIGARVMIMKGVTIGDGAIIGSGCVISKNVEAFAVVGGGPMRVLRAPTLNMNGSE